MPGGSWVRRMSCRVQRTQVSTLKQPAPTRLHEERHRRGGGHHGVRQRRLLARPQLLAQARLQLRHHRRHVLALW